MLTLMLSTALYVLSTPPTEPVAFDETRAKAHYESFFYEHFMRDWPDDEERAKNLKGSANRQRPAVKVEPWPVDPSRGLYCNSADRLGRFGWVAIGRTEPPTQQPVQEPTICALSDMSYHFYYGFKGHVAPDLCVERPGTTAAWQGAAACYFSARAEYQNPGFWVALREVDGKVVVAGVLEHKEFMDEPEKDRRLKPFLDAIEKRFGPAPDPKAPKPGKRP